MVIFCENLDACKAYKEQLKNALIFCGEDAGELYALLEHFKSLSYGIILTTSAYCKGADFVFAVPQAFVIHTSLPKTFI